MQDDKVKVWDIPTRLFHWSIVLLCLSGWVSSEIGDVNLIWHSWNGYILLCLLLFRLAWGFLGSSTSLFRNFITSPNEAIAYLQAMLRGEHRPYAGHNPAGGLMVVALLLVLFAIAICGLFATDDIASQGPLAHLAPSLIVTLLTILHKKLFWILSILVVIHVAAVIYHQLILHENLVEAMITGNKPANKIPTGANLQIATTGRAVICLIAAVGMLYYILVH